MHIYTQSGTCCTHSVHDLAMGLTPSSLAIPKTFYFHTHKHKQTFNNANYEHMTKDQLVWSFLLKTWICIFWLISCARLLITLDILLIFHCDSSSLYKTPHEWQTRPVSTFQSRTGVHRTQTANITLYNIYVPRIINKQKLPFSAWDLAVFLHVNTTKQSKNNTQSKKWNYFMSWQWELKSQAKTVSKYSHTTVMAMATTHTRASARNCIKCLCPLLDARYRMGERKC
jgi:hypothetical protein